MDYLTFDILRTSISSIDIRKDFLQNGIEIAKKFLENLENSI